jgi:hypothetical protein
MLPPVVDHVTEVLLDPVTVAVNCCVAFVEIEAETGLRDIPIGTVTVTVADAVLVVSATLLAVMV